MESVLNGPAAGRWTRRAFLRRRGGRDGPLRVGVQRWWGHHHFIRPAHAEGWNDDSVVLRALRQTLLDVIAVRRDALAAHGDALCVLVAGHLRALHAWRINPVDTAYRFAPRVGLRAPVIPDPPSYRQDYLPEPLA